MQYRNKLTLVYLSLILLTSTAASAATSDPMVRLPGHVLPALSKATRVEEQSASHAEQSLTLTLVLKRDDQAGFDRYLHDVYDPQSSIYRTFLTASELSDRFGPSRQAYAEVLAYVQRKGFVLVAGSENRLTLTVRGTRAQVERVFDVSLNDYRLDTTRFFANEKNPALPRTIATSVHAITGLSNFAVPRPSFLLAAEIAALRAISAQILELAALRAEAFAASSAINEIAAASIPEIAALDAQIAALVEEWLAINIAALSRGVSLDVPKDSLLSRATPGTTGQRVTQTSRVRDLLGQLAATAKQLSVTREAEAAFGIPLPTSATGRGQKIGIPAFSSFQLSDIADWLAFVGLPASMLGQVSQVHVNGGAPRGPAESEVLLSVTMILGLARDAQVVVYDAPFVSLGTSFQALFNAMINDRVSVISNSFIYCEDQTTLADVQSLDAILATAAALGISVFSATGDAGSSCKNGSTDTIAVPANSPHVTAVGGTSMKVIPGLVYGGESWWDGANQTPPTGQGGFGVSRFFARPGYQSGVSNSPMRSVPDVVALADPRLGTRICQANAGGCPSKDTHGGTSMATPIWAAIAVLLNEGLQQPLGLANTLLYPLAGTNAFHSAAELGSDVAHVGLGSPNVNLLFLALTGQTPGPTDPSISSVKASLPHYRPPVLGSIYADGSTAATVVVRLRDAKGNLIVGKTVALSANAGSHAVVTPPSGISSQADGTVVFTVTNLTPEIVKFTAVNTSDGTILQQSPTVTFIAPPPQSASINALPLTLDANGISTATITVTLRDALNRPIPGKVITLAQGNGHSVITGPNPSVTDSNGQIRFSATNLVNEVVTYTAIDVSDGNFRVPGSAVVTFINGSGGACGQNTVPPTGLNGYSVTPFATGFATGALFFGNINFGGCSGVAPPGFLESSLYVPNFFNGELFKLGPSGGTVSTANKLSTIGPTLGWVVAGKDGKLYATRTAILASPPNFTNGAIVELDPTTGAVKRTLVSNLPCSQGLVVDPLSGDLFFDGQCFGAGSNNPNLFRVRNPGSTTPTLEVYATLPGSPNGQIAFSPRGTIYVVVNYLLANPPVYRVSGTNVPGPPTVTDTGVVSNYWLNIGNVAANGEATALVTLNVENNVGRLKLTDLTTTPPRVLATMAEGSGGGVIGPDGCLYMPNSNVLHKLTDPNGGCSFLPTNAKPALSLTPTAVSPNPAQGDTQTFTATFRNLNVPVGTPVTLAVIGPNQQGRFARTDASGRATFTYTGTFVGTDAIVATATVGAQTFTSNVAQVSWVAGKHATFLSFASSPTSSFPNQPVTVAAVLSDISANPPAPVAGATVNFALGSARCVGITNGAGRASCTVTPTVTGLQTLTATFAGTAQFVASSTTTEFSVLALAPSCTPTAEVCDGRDNDCDQQTDEGLGTRSCGVGACARTVNACQNGRPQICTPGSSTTEICGDGIDQDCNGQDLSCPPAAKPGDLMCDGDVDVDDLNILNRNLNKLTSQSSCRLTTCNTTCDLDKDGKITVLDARKLVNLCTRPRCAVR